MCSIMGYQGKTLDEKTFKEHFDATISRGPDDQRISTFDGGIMGFERLSIMGLTPEGMQPFNLNNNMLVCNGEIYGFRPIKD
jgi:asparagine synthase (glutamine-hydrolysing)